MKFPRRSRLLALFLPLAFVAATASTPAQDANSTPETIRSLLQEFLAHNDEPAQHERFWAGDLVYTSAKGEVKGKADIMESVAASKPDPTKLKDTYTAEDVLVRPYGTTAALTFRLVRHTPDGKLQYYRNSGTLLRRDGRWQVVTWQATLIPAAAEQPAK